MADRRKSQRMEPTRKSAPVRRRKRKKVQARFYGFLVVLVLVVVGIVALITMLGGKDDGKNVPVSGTQNTFSGLQDVTSSANGEQTYGTLAQWLGDEGSDLQGLTEEQQVQVEDLSVTQGLPSEWFNVLLLGADARNLEESCRTDTMMICSLNIQTGEVKLTSVARDTAILFENIGQYNGTYRINSANFFGGPELAMKVINEHLDMNIEYYVLVNFYGFEYIVEKLGGVDITITQAEMDEINIWQKKQYGVEEKYGYDMSGLEKELLETYGENTHLNGRQTLAYCRIRKLDSDFSRTERQRTVLTKLKEKLMGKSAMEIVTLAGSLQQYFATNLTIDQIVSVATTVLSSEHLSVEQFRLPVNDTYKQETRNEQSMLYDCDWEKNALELYNFIYE